MMRSGPKPLPFHLGMASLASAGLAGGADFSETTLQDFFRGIKKYQTHAFARPATDWPVAWSEGQATLYCTGKGEAEEETPIVLIPSMINKSAILDLLPDHSLFRWLSLRGFSPYLMDWGKGALDPGQKSFDLVLTERLIPAIEALGKPVLLMGYCMGGLFATALTHLRPDLVKGCVLLATPWNFHDEAGSIRNRLILSRPTIAPYIKQYNHLPENFMQMLFASLDPESSIRKFSSFAGMKEDDPKAELFVAVEDWLNEGEDLPSGIARTCIEDWYENNLPFAKEWKVCGETIVAGNIKVPTFVIAARNDKIVPLDSAMAFADQRVKCDRLIHNTGHIGLMVGTRAVQDVWKPMAEWFAAQQ